MVGDDAQSIYSFRAATVRNILDFPDQFDAAGARRHARAQLPLDAADPRRVECGDRARRRAPRQEPVDRPAFARTGRSWSWCATRPTRRAAWPSGCSSIARAGIALKTQAVLFRSASHSAPLELELTRRDIPVREVRRPQVPRGGARQGRAGRAALGGESAQPDGRLSRGAAAPRHRPGHGDAAARRDGTVAPSRCRRCRRSRCRRPPQPTGRRSSSFCARFAR